MCSHCLFLFRLCVTRYQVLASFSYLVLSYLEIFYRFCSDLSLVVYDHGRKNWRYPHRGQVYVLIFQVYVKRIISTNPGCAGCKMLLQIVSKNEMSIDPSFQRSAEKADLNILSDLCWEKGRISNIRYQVSIFPAKIGRYTSTDLTILSDFWRK